MSFIYRLPKALSHLPKAFSELGLGRPRQDMEDFLAQEEASVGAVYEAVNESKPTDEN